jgi:VanZ family protein
MYCGVLFWLSSGASPVHPHWLFRHEDKIVHAALYGGLATVVSLGIRRSGRLAAPAVQFVVPILFAFLYGVTDEIHQALVPNRSCDVWDLAADTVGACIVQIILCGCVWRSWARKKVPAATDRD